jgi:hypothetical protein
MKKKSLINIFKNLDGYKLIIYFNFVINANCQMLYKIKIAEQTLNKLVLVFILSSFVSLQAQPKFESGTWSVNQSVSGYALDNNNGERSITLDVHFTESFIKKPFIILTVTQLDADKDVNLRYRVETISVSRDGFTLKVNTWADSKIYSLSGNWLAYAE